MKIFYLPELITKKNRPQLEIEINKEKSSDLEISNYEIGRTLEIL